MAYDGESPDSDPGEPQLRVRPDVWGLEEWDDTLLWYARAITELQTRPLDDPTSWRYQAAIHAYNRSRDPYADPADSFPSAADRQRFWNQCQHGTWYFLPWHRMYLGYFEQIVAAAVEQLGGPAGWSLPYWNYSDDSNPDARRIPPAFRAATLPDGSPNPLLVEQRRDGVNDGDIIADDFDVDISDCLDETVFVGTSFGGTTGFGGPETSFQHSGGAAGKVEATPHGDMHMAVGGLMSSFATAGLDPLFWLHHANIDRLWTVWNKRQPTNVNPSQSAWLDQPEFEFHDASGGVVTLTSGEVADSATSLFAYRYEDESDPLAVPTPEDPAALAAEAGLGATPMEKAPPAEMVGATEHRMTLRRRPVTTRIELSAATGPSAGLSESAAPPRIHLAVENIRGSEPIPQLVYVNLPEGADPAEHPERLAGTLPMFGLPEASGEDPEHPGSGLQYSLDITGLAEELGEEWAPDELRVTIVPKASVGAAPAAALEEPGAEPPAIEIGRISVYRSR